MAGSPPKDNSAQIARQEEQARQARITAGRGEIDRNFSQFNDPYYAGVATDVTKHYGGQLQDQYDQARRNLVLTLARSGTLNGSAGARQQGLLAKTFADQQADIADRGQTAANTQRAEIENQRRQLYAQNSAAGDPSIAAQSSLAATRSLPAPTFSPLQDAFASILNSAANYQLAGNAGYRDPRYTAPQANATSGSFQVVR